jgi:uncharacterized protein DUF4440
MLQLIQKYNRFFLMTIILAGSISLNAQENKETDSLYKKIMQLDSVVFNAFNSRNTEQFKLMFTKDLEFYHDKGGLTNYDYTISFMESVAKSSNDLKRELIKESLEVYPIPGYGAMEIGAHSFCHTENGKKDCGTYKFVHIWQYKNGEWKISRVVSYGH